jgi:hypothetical protein
LYAESDKDEAGQTHQDLSDDCSGTLHRDTIENSDEVGEHSNGTKEPNHCQTYGSVHDMLAD